jgi:hypothetical protein
MGLLRESTARENSAVFITVILSVVFVFLYSLAFPRTLGKELFFVAGTAVPLSDDLNQPLKPGGSFFRLGEHQGYWSEDGTLLQSLPLKPQMVTDGQRFAWYDSVGEQIVVEGIKGVLFQVKDQKYPYWSGGRLFALDENRLALTALGAAGQTLWTKHFSSLISAVDANSEHTVVGTLDGKVQVFDLKGNSAGPFVPGGSRVPVIFNVAISRDGQRLLVLAGIDPKRFLLLEKGGGDFRPVFHKSLTENKPWPTWLGFLDEGQLSFHEVEEAVIINQISNGAQESLLPFKGHLEDLHFLSAKKLILLLTNDKDKQSLVVDSLEGRPVLKVTFLAREVLLRTSGDTFLLGVDQSLLTMKLSYR